MPDETAILEATTIAPAEEKPASPPQATEHAIWGERESDFLALQKSIAAAIAPQDPMEEAWVEDIADNFWELRRLRRLRDALFQSTYSTALADLLELNLGFAQKLRFRETAAVEVHNKWKQDGVFSEDAVHAKTLTLQGGTFDMIDKLKDNLLKRNLLMMREIREHRTFSRDTILAIEAAGKRFEEAQYSEVAPEARDD
jgi:hypothetical protein